jgi:hypothetical protein
MPRPICEHCGQDFANSANLTRHKNNSCAVLKSKNIDEGQVPIEKDGIKKDEVETSNKDDEIVSLIKDKLTINGIEIFCRESDGFINLTSISKAGQHRLDHYLENDKTKAFIKALSEITENREINFITTSRGQKGGTWAHRLVAYNYIQHMSPIFAAQVSQWLDNLFINGSVTLGKEDSFIELEKKYKDQILQLESEKELALLKLELILNPVIPKLPKIRKSPANYLVKDPRDIDNLIKYGQTSNMLNVCNNIDLNLKVLTEHFSV